MGRHHCVLLQAALGEGEPAADAYRSWRASVRLDDIDAAAYRVLPLLLATAEKHGLQDPDARRLGGIAKHIWLSNMLRMQALSTALTALSAAGIRTLLLKGAALFARYEQLAAVRLTEDYDLLVRLSDAPRAITALAAAGFKSQFSLQADLFAGADFETIHAAHFIIESKRNRSSLDLHWRPLPRLLDPAHVDDMFLHAELATIAGRSVELASLADHLFLVVARPEPWEGNETFARTVEAVQLLRASGGRIDWTRFEHLVVSFGVECIAASMLRLVRDEVQAPVPDGLVERLWARRASLKALELAIRRTPPYRRGKLRRLALRAIELARTTPGETGLAAAVAVVAHREPRAHLLQALGECVGLAKPNLDRVWGEQAERAMRLTGLSFARGFSFPEEEGRWTDGEIAVLELPVDTPVDATVRVLMVVRAFFPPGATEFAFKTATGIGKVRRHVLRPEQGPRVELTVEARAVGTPTRKAVVVLQLLDAGRPIVLGLSDDPRLLGLYVERALADNDAPQTAPTGKGVPPSPA